MRIDFSNILLMSDLDGTFLSSETKPVERNMKALERFRAGGGLFSFVTGRVHTTLEKNVLPGYREMINCPAIMCNGSCVYDPFSETMLFEEFLDGAKIRPLAEKICGSGKFTVYYYVGGEYSCYRDTPLDQVESNCWHKVVFVGSIDDVAVGRKILAENQTEDYRFFRASPRILEILPAKAGKGQMLRNLKQWYAQQGRSLKTIGVGDYENDLDLMDCADISVCPANAMPEVKQKADHIFCDHNQGVIADIIEALEKGELE